MDVWNKTAGHCETVIAADKDGRQYVVPILKYTFDIGVGGFVKPAKEPSPIDIADTYYGEEPAASSIRRPSQLFEAKPGTDVVLIAEAHPPTDREVTQLDVMLRMGPIRKIVRAYGFRVWQVAAFGGLTAGPAMPIRKPIPLTYELAWGGVDLTDPANPLAEPRNYSGRGICREPKRLVGQPAAQLEDPERPIGSRGVRPAAFGAIHRHWQPRFSFAGTYDQAWQDARMPLLPVDFDNRFHVCVPEDQWSPTPLRSDEPIEVLGVVPEGLFSCKLPRISPGFSSVIQGKRQDYRTHLDTVLINAVERKVELTWRAAVLMPKKLEVLEKIEVVEKEVV
jgi:hypothetical protein